ncbi:MAG: adenylate/guanylate cyclase domain-containing protein [Spirochaetes bacterium]|nr:adenylate/guanylate cyclase domain-containing protein [Spirochaetota bacterium]
MKISSNFYTSNVQLKKLLLASISGLIFFILLILIYQAGWLDNLELLTVDWRMKFLSGYSENTQGEVQSSQSSGQVVYVDLDQGSLDAAQSEWQMGWPWPREGYGLALQYLQQGGAQAVTFDMFMDNPSPFGDHEFASFLTNYQNVVQAGMFVRSNDKTPQKITIDQQVEKFSLELTTDDSVLFPVMTKPYAIPTDLILNESQWMGDAYIIAEGADRRHLRKNSLIVQYNNRYYPSLALATVLSALQTREVEVKNQKIIIKSKSRQISIPVDKQGFMWIKFYGPSRSYQTYPLFYVITSFLAEQAALQGDENAKNNILINKAEFSDKMIIIKSSAPGLKDLRPNPFSDNDDGGHIHGSAVDTILQNDFLTDLYHPLILFSIFLVLSLLASITGAALPSRISGLVFSFLIAGFILLTALLFTNNIIIETAGSVLALMIPYILGVRIHLTFENKQKEFVQGAFSQFLAPSILQKLLKDRSHLHLGGEEKEISIFFSDLQGFTSLSEKLSPTELVEILNTYLTDMADNIVVDHEGYVDKYEGDAIMAFWGAPIDDHLHAVKACLAALDNQQKMINLQKYFKEKGLSSELVVRIGINTGKAVVGMMGSMRKLNYTVIGDAVNLASRLEGANKAYQTRIMISEATYQEAKEAIEVRELDLLRVKGKEQPVRVYELLAKRGQLTDPQKKMASCFQKGLTLYRQQKWVEAISQFTEALKYQKADGPAQLYIQRCQAFQQKPPPANWDGVYVMKTK